jgi:oligoribonuclease (3'-5' exoribonuclease)
MIRDDLIFWFDLETTGSNVETSRILELGAVLTDATPELNIIDRRNWIINPEDDPNQFEVEHEDILVTRIDPVVLEMHLKNNLWRDVQRSNLRIREAEDQILGWLSYTHKVRKGQLVPYAGSGVGHFDRAYIRRYMPKLSGKLTFWPYDVGVLRRMFRLVGWEVAKDLGELPHRGLADTLHEIDEARILLAALRQPAWHNKGIIGHSHPPVGMRPIEREETIVEEATRPVGNP